MTRLRSLSRNRALLAAIAVIAVWMILSGAFSKNTSANALWHYGYYDTIYTDASKTEECGFYDSCTNTHGGCSTPYRDTEVVICP